MHLPREPRPGDVANVDDIPGAWNVYARPIGQTSGDGPWLVMCGDRSTAIARGMAAAHGDYYGARHQYDQVTIKHADHTVMGAYWSAVWTRSDDMWREYGPVNDRGWTFAGRHAHAVRMAANEPPERTPTAVGEFVGNRPVVTIDGHRYMLVSVGGGLFTVLRPDGVIGYVSPWGVRDHGSLVQATARALAEPDPNATCPVCGAGRGQYCRPAPGEPGHITDQQDTDADDPWGAVL